MKRLPSITTLPKDEQTFRQVLEFIYESDDQEEFEHFLQSEFGFSKSGSKKMRNSLGKFNFIIKEDSVHKLSDDSERFIEGELTFDEFIYNILVSSRFELKNFICDLIDILKKYKALTKKEILSRISEEGYASHLSRLKESSQMRNLTDILKMTNHALITSTENSKFSVGPRAESYKHESMEKDFFNDLHKFIRKYAFNQDVLTDNELLRLHRLWLRAYARGGRWGIESQIRDAKEFLNSNKIRDRIEKYNKKKKRSKRKRIPSEEERKESLWSLRHGIKLYKWQNECLDSWFLSNNRGVIEVVTGAGKTIFALAAIQRLKKDINDLIVSIIVPTKALMYQWLENLLRDFQMAKEDVGLKGDGHQDSFDQGKRIMIYIYNSAVLHDNLVNDVDAAGNSKHLLIVDECHRSGSPKFREIYNARYDYTIGLSATPDKPTDDTFKSVIEPNIGEIIYKYSFNEALRDGIIPPFEIYNYAIELTDEERREYDELTDEIRKTVKRIKSRYYHRLKGVSDDLFEAVLRKIQNELDVPDPDISRYFVTTNKRKRDILYRAENRWKLVQEILEENRDSKVIMFHENIDVVDFDIYKNLKRADAVIYHSKFFPKDNEITLELFRRDKAKILVSVKALIEGLDVPETDVGIIVASSSSPTQRIQSMGRILRQTAIKKEKGTPSKLYVIYVKDTTDERIFSRIEWSNVTTKDSIHYELWTPNGRKPIEAPIHTRVETIPCEEVNVSELEVGVEYPGSFEGTKLSCDHRGKVFEKTYSGRQYFKDPAWDEIVNLVMSIKPKGGVFVVNDCGHILVKGKKGGKLRTLFLGVTDLLKEEVI